MSEVLPGMLMSRGDRRLFVAGAVAEPKPNGEIAGANARTSKELYVMELEPDGFGPCVRMDRAELKAEWVRVLKGDL